MSEKRNDCVRNSISFDLEHWHTATLLVDEVRDPIDRIVESTEIVLDLLDRHDVAATFFVVGDVADEYPWLINRIHELGHEIGSHGQTHRPLFDLSPSEFERELAESGAAIESVTGEFPMGVRLPNFSLTRRTQWGFEVLARSEYRYDSSVFPVKTPMYGVPGGPLRPYRVHPGRPFDSSAAVGSQRELLVESPLAVTNTMLRLPIGGGFYARVTPIRLFEWAVSRLNESSIPANLYFHPWEFNPSVPVSEPKFHKRAVSFAGIERLADKVERLLTTFEFGPVSELIRAELGQDVFDEPRPRTNHEVSKGTSHH
ncbi:MULTISPECIES: polysaccharide deacetylase family protein [Haloferax]|uniref:Peptidoglycan deacetylase n=1 Tax=Haloferax massiliensis TaxID=1476858 RepID=A0A0D6JV53_9EURY|nr:MULTISPECIES: polysaccharide deacetylase family protein [Haloferax]MDS0241774.1 polysaccharide deacetylase family protein [Haloferax sp. S2CR25]MDS0444895.1 polysaccharide deacetylase family protein [Haloferax sp. S2CR25-2]CQR52687.1 Peptidoglycan deacetylase [Haloferax massiliensis]